MDHGEVAHDAHWRAWCLNRLDRAGYGTDEGAAVRYAVSELARTIQELNIPPERAARAVELLSGFVAGSDVPDRLILAGSSDRAVRWAPLPPGGIGKGIRVRVRPDAYDGRKHVHNGMQGKIVGVRHGSISVQYDNMPVGSVAYHNRNMLECES